MWQPSQTVHVASSSLQSWLWSKYHGHCLPDWLRHPAVNATLTQGSLGCSCPPNKAFWNMADTMLQHYLCVYTKTKQYTPITSAIHVPQKGLMCRSGLFTTIILYLRNTIRHQWHDRSINSFSVNFTISCLRHAFWELKLVATTVKVTIIWGTTSQVVYFTCRQGQNKACLVPLTFLTCFLRQLW